MESPAVGSRTDSRRGGRGFAALALRRPWGRWLALLGLFALLVLAVELGWWDRMDDMVDDWAASHRVTVLWDAAKTVFDVTSPEVVLSITLALGLLVAWRRRRWGIAADAAIRLALVVASVLLLKPLVAVPSPRNSLGDHGGAFPSGHTTAMVVCATLLLAWLGRPRSKTGRAALTAVVVVTVGATVIYIHYHNLSDVVGGLVLGLLIATLPVSVPRRNGRVQAEPDAVTI